MLQFKDKVIEVENAKTGLHIDTELEKNLIYIKETFQHIYTKLSKIYNYIGLSDVVYELSKINTKKITNTPWYPLFIMLPFIFYLINQ